MTREKPLRGQYSQHGSLACCYAFAVVVRHDGVKSTSGGPWRDMRMSTKKAKQSSTGSLTTLVHCIAIL